ncbi:MAG: putative DNA base hypermodification protein [Candidatus Absconditabacteria bacterium]|nr:putative DNA base hypermodification protein [Candidatus Absconditabacteria bacterium]MDD3868445.1 putative DNA base hypermodification protein [Candidatus Absconditabacteria bacterium]MDD4713981.1 putative DNA base hypermodification protein [Candidatus Absconditabacteria bacterium]
MNIRPEAFQWYFYFIQERMAIFWKRYHGASAPYSEDDIFQSHKFTNVYRVLDRTTQALLRKVIYHPDASSLDAEDLLLNILLFKIFNREETRDALYQQFGFLGRESFDVAVLCGFLTSLQQQQAIFSSAYIMTGAVSLYQGTTKQETWLRMVEGEFIKQKKLRALVQAQSLEELYQIFCSCPLIGGFLGYQYAIDMNYSPVITFDENDFVKAGIGAMRGIKKCFVDLEGGSYEDAIRRTQANLPELQKKFGWNDFQPLPGRAPSLIDLQNCFCETDKYLRVKLPELSLGNVRIKQKFIEKKNSLDLIFPPKWGIVIDGR